MFCARKVSLVNHVSLPFKGSVSQSSLALADVDGDGEAELVVGTLEGDLTVYKAQRKLAVCSDLGTITCILTTEAPENDRTCVVVTCAEGTCHLFDLTGVKLQEEEASELPPKIEPVGVFKVPWNVTSGTCIEFQDERRIALAAHDGGVLSNTAIQVLSIRFQDGTWQQTLKNEWTVPGRAVSLCHIFVGSNPMLLVGLQFGGMLSISTSSSQGVVFHHRFTNNANKALRAEEASSSFKIEAGSGKPLTFNEGWDGPIVMNTPTYIHAVKPEAFDDSEDDDSQLDDVEQERGFPIATALVVICFDEFIRVERLSIQVDGKGSEGLYNELTWQGTRTRNVFALSTIDLHRNGNENLVSCTLDGLTCIYDSEHNVAQFLFKSRVQGFLAGRFQHDLQKLGQICYFYVTLDKGITIYTAIEESIRKIKLATLTTVLTRRGHYNAVREKLVHEDVDEEMQALQEHNIPAFYAKALHKHIYKR
mmetsp:Transcript_12767/g.22749  ORF Transcript_12767/g.22749 Transcript_12767/m.22749 type:complete len:478 (-) Transcript_12767:215-1648(-)